MKRYLLVTVALTLLLICIAFSACTCNEDITINGTEAEVNGLKLTKIDSGWMISSVTDGTKTSYDIPKEHDGFTIASIHSDAFKNCKNLEKITIPDNITYVGSRAFAGCDSLNEVYINNGSALIESTAFEGCPVRYARVPSSQITILPRASLKEVDLVGGTIPESAFWGFEILTTISIVGDVSFLDSSLNGCTAVTFKLPPSKIESFGSKHKVVNLVISPSLEENPSLVIHNAAFVDYSFLKSITFEGGYAYDLKENAFAGCVATDYDISGELLERLPLNTKKITVSSGEIKYLGTTRNLPVEFLIIKQGVTKVESGAFRECKSLKSVSFIASCDAIEDYTFYKCPMLTKIDIGDKIKTIESNAFSECTALEEITLTGSIKALEKTAFKGCTGLKSLRLENSVETVSDNAFENCTALERVYIGSGLKSFSYNAFAGCNAINQFVIDGANSILKSVNYSLYSKDGKTLIRYATNSEITDLTLSDSVTTILSGAFYGESYLERITLPASVTKIEASAFENCTSLISIKLPEKLEVIENNTFKGCISLGSIAIPNSVKIIKEDAFNNCTALLHLTIGKDVKEIQKNAFYNCDTLVSVIIPENVEILGETIFGSCENIALISCEAKEKPESWHDRWFRGNNAEIVWGFESQSGGI